MKSKIALLTFAFLAITVSVSAQTITPTPATIRDAVQQKVEEELSNIRQAVAKKGFVGNITAKTENNVTLTNLRSQSRQITVAPDATIKLVDNKDGTVADLKVNDFTLVMGDVDSQNKMTGKRILVLKAPAEDKRQVIYATVTKSVTGTITVENLKKETWTLKVSSTTAYTTSTDGKIVKAAFADVETGSKLVVVGTTATGTNTLATTNVHLLP